MNISLRQLQAFVYACKYGSFSEAAQAMGMTQPGLSQLIKQMEKALGLKVFHRTTRQLVLTVAGREMLERAQRTLLQFDEFKGHAEDLHAGRQGTLKIAVITSVACSLLPPVLQAFSRTCPGVKLIFEEEPAELLLSTVRQGAVELGWGLNTTPSDDLVFEPLYRDRMMALMPIQHELASRERLTWHDLNQYPLISASRHSGVRIYSERAAENAGVQLQPSYLTDTLSTAIALVRHCLGCAAMPALSLQSLNLDQIAVRPLEEPEVWREVGLVRRRGWPLSPSALSFAQLVRQACVSSTPS
jgi:LysR family transcriptional regulator, carnitine catabolism transcriptional activator